MPIPRILPQHLLTMAPVSTSTDIVQKNTEPVKAAQPTKVYNPFYSPPGDDDGNETYKFSEFKVRNNVAQLSLYVLSDHFKALVPKFVLGASERD